MAEYPKVGFAAFVDGLESGMNSMSDYLLKRDKLRQNQLDWDAQNAYGDRNKGGGDYSGGGEGNAPAIGGAGSSEGKGGEGGVGKAGEGGIQPENLYTYLTQTLGATPNEAALLTSAANNESNFRPDVTHDGGIGYGLWGHNGSRLKAMRQSAGVGEGDLVPWEKQANFALDELRSTIGVDRLNDPNMTPEKLTDLQLEYERPKGWNTGGGNRAGRLAATTQYLANPPLLAGAIPGDTSGIPQPSGRVGSAPLTEPPGATQVAGTPASPAEGTPGEMYPATPTAVAAPAGATPDTVQTSAYTAPRSTVQPASYAGPSGPAFVGDSLAGGFHRAAGGNPNDVVNGDPTNTTAAIVNGRGPMNTLAYLHSLPDGYFQGRPVVFSGGASNNPGEIANAYPAAMDELKRLGAGQVHVVGVGMKADYEGGHYYDLNQHNKTIQQIAEKGGARFTGGIPAVVHPGRDYYPGVLKRLNQPQAAIGAPDQDQFAAPQDQSQYAALVPTAAIGSDLYRGYG